jgi:hypothetical protein
MSLLSVLQVTRGGRNEDEAMSLSKCMTIVEECEERWTNRGLANAGDAYLGNPDSGTNIIEQRQTEQAN